jgi:vacuolar-type H+-ATPase subunit I/STV1
MFPIPVALSLIPSGSIFGMPVVDIAFGFLLLVAGVIVIMLIGALIFLLPAAILALVVWFLTGSMFWAGVVFLVIAVISLLKKH